MVRLIEFPQEMEHAVKFVEDTEPERIVEATFAKLRAGESPATLFAAAALAVSRSSELPTDHHGGPVHPVSGIHASHQIATRLDGDWRHLPLVQNVALANKHIHSPDMGQAAMSVVEPADADGKDVAALLAGFADALVDRQSRTAERYLARLVGLASPGEILDAMLTVGIRRNVLDDHYLLYPVFAVRALDDIGWEWAEAVLRPPVRYLARHPSLEPVRGLDPASFREGVDLYNRFSELEALIDDNGLDDGRVDAAARGRRNRRHRRAGRDHRRGGRLQDRHRAARRGPGRRPVARRDRRGAVGGRRHAVPALAFGQPVRRPYPHRNQRPPLSDRPRRRRPAHQAAGAADLAAGRRGAFPGRLPALARARRCRTGERRPGRAARYAIAASITSQPVVDYDTLDLDADVPLLPDEVVETLGLARRYAEAGYDPAPFFALMGRLVCRDDVSEMHAYKLQQAAFEEYGATREPYRWVHMVSAAKHAACVVAMEPKTVYPRARALFDA